MATCRRLIPDTLKLETTKLRGVDLLHNPWLNKGSTFTAEERERLGLRGLLPPAVSTRAAQMGRLRELLDRCKTDMDKFLLLDGIQNDQENLFYRLLIDNVEEFLPVVYTPTVGDVCLRYSHIFRYARGAYVSSLDKGHVREIIENMPNEEVDVIVVTDGERILGLGDLGLNGMGIPVGKLSLYTACAGIHPGRTLPVLIDVGTENEAFLEDPLYMGLRQRRVRGPEYYELVDEFITEARRRWPNVLIQFEDFGNHNAFELLHKYRDKILCFNDDIQGTAVVALAGLYSALRVKGEALEDQRVLFMGAGEAATGMANLIVDALIDKGYTRDEAYARCALFDSKGLVVSGRTDLNANKLPFAKDMPQAKTFADAIREFKPTAIIGAAAQAKSFTKEVIELMSELNERPIIFALSNPTSRAECSAEEAYTWSRGKALFASGSPFPACTYEGKTFVPRQGNNCYVFPGIGLGAVYSQVTHIPNGMFLVAAQTLASLVTEEDLQNGSLYPPLKDVREISAKIATKLAEFAWDHGLAHCDRPADIEEEIKHFMYEPSL